MPYRHTPVTEIDQVNKLFIYHFTLSIEPHSVYAISFFWYGILGFFITYIIGYFASLIFSEYLRSIILVCATQWNLDIRTSLALLYIEVPLYYLCLIILFYQLSQKLS